MKKNWRLSRNADLIDWQEARIRQKHICYKDSPAPPPAPDYKGAAEATAAGNLQSAQAATAANRYDQYTPLGSQTWSGGPDNWASQVNLSPTGQSLFDQYNRTSQGLAGMTDQALGRVGDVQSRGFDMSGVQGGVGNVQMGQLPEISEAARTAAENAAYGRATSRLDPQWNDRQTDTETQLRNQGLVPGGEAYDKAERNLTFARNDAYDQARMGAVQQGLQAQQAQFGMGLAGNQQQFSQGLSNANLANTLRGQQIQEQSYLRNLPLNELNALRTGSQVGMPSFQPGGQQQVTPGANYAGAAGQQGAYDQNVYNQQVGASNANTAGMTGLASAAMMAMAMY